MNKAPKTNLLPKLGPVESSHVSFDHRISSSLLVVLDSIDQSHLCNPTPARWKSRISQETTAETDFGVLFLASSTYQPRNSNLEWANKDVWGENPPLHLVKLSKRRNIMKPCFFLEDKSPISLLFHGRSQRFSTKGCQKQKPYPKKCPREVFPLDVSLMFLFVGNSISLEPLTFLMVSDFRTEFRSPNFERFAETLSNRKPTTNKNG